MAYCYLRQGCLNSRKTMSLAAYPKNLRRDSWVLVFEIFSFYDLMLSQQQPTR